MRTGDEAEGRLSMLTPYDCWSLLETSELGRIAWSGASGVALRPVNCTVADGSLWFRTDPGSALARECGGQRVVVEVDEVDPADRSGWSVVVVGTAELMDVLDVPESVDLRVWPSGPHSMFVRVRADEITGRRLFGARAR